MKRFLQFFICLLLSQAAMASQVSNNEADESRQEQELKLTEYSIVRQHPAPRMRPTCKLPHQALTFVTKSDQQVVDIDKSLPFHHFKKAGRVCCIYFCSFLI